MSEASLPEKKPEFQGKSQFEIFFLDFGRERKKNVLPRTSSWGMEITMGAVR